MAILKVLVIGAGLGGLSLAQSLRAQDVDVQVYERDSSPWDRPQGYRLHLEADALNALREVLPAGLHRVFRDTAMRTQPSGRLARCGGGHRRPRATGLVLQRRHVHQCPLPARRAGQRHAAG